MYDHYRDIQNEGERDNTEGYNVFYDFVDTITASNVVKDLVVHARSAVLQGLSPRKNREVPKLKKDYVYRLAKERKDLRVVLNGGIRTKEDEEYENEYENEENGGGKSQAIKRNFDSLEGIMIGRFYL